jgi:uncharacterized protein (DUF2252 family)
LPFGISLLLVLISRHHVCFSNTKTMKLTILPRPSERASILSAHQKLKMAASAHAYVRGNTVKFYQWLESQKRNSLPEGPPVWICGDCHAGNLGPVADAKGRVEIQIRDFDQTVIGNPGHDLIRKDGLCLMDVREAARAAAPQSRNASMPRNSAARVVEGARRLSPSLGERMLAAQLGSRPIFVRELLPQDLKLEIAQLTRAAAMRAAMFLAGVVGKAHARQMDAATRQRWRRELSHNRSKSMDAPSWLWSSVVALIAAHETSYLEHCRRFAMEVTIVVRRQRSGEQFCTDSARWTTYAIRPLNAISGVHQ